MHPRNRLLSAVTAAIAGFLAATLSPSAASADEAADQFAAIREEALLAARSEADGISRASKIAKLGDVGSAEAAKVILECIDVLAVKNADLQKTHAATLKTYEPFAKWDSTEDKFWTTKRRLLETLEKEDDRLQSDGIVQTAMGVTLGKFSNPQAVALFEKAATTASLEFSRSVLLGGLIRSPATKAGDIAKKAMKDGDPQVRLASLEAMADRKDPSLVEPLIAALKESDWPLRKAAVRALAIQGDVRGVPALVAQMQFEVGALLEDFGTALTALTGATLGNYPDVWRRWYEEHKKELEERGAKAAAPKTIQKGEPQKVTYYGVESLSKKVVFIVDVSGSMKEPIGQEKTSITGEKADVYEGLKIDIAKRILIKAVHALPKDTMFEVILFNHAVKPVLGGMHLATDDNKHKVDLAVDTLEPAGATWAYGALREAFQLAGKTVTETNLDPCVDTIFFLSDGAPTDDSIDKAKPMKPQEIFSAVQEWNRTFKIRIHTIAIDPRINGSTFVAFMQNLASKNGGTYTPIGSK